MKKRVARIVSAMLAVVMILTGSMIHAFAASTVACKRTYKNYCIIGDSVASGFTLDPDNPDDPYTFLNENYHQHDDIPEGSYPDLLLKAASVPKYYKLAREGFSAMSVLRVLDPSYEEELAQPENYYDRYFTECMYWSEEWKCLNPYPFTVLEMRLEAQDAVAAADVITINLGNNDIFTNSLLDPMIRYFYYMYGMAAQPTLTAMWGMYEPVTSLDQAVAMVGSYKDILTLVEENFEKYKKNYERLIKRIRELNPDAEIYVLGMYDVFDQDGPESAIQQYLAKYNRRLIKELKTFYTKESKYRNTIHYVDIRDTEIWPTTSMYTLNYYTSFITHFHPTFEGHRYIANQIIKAMNKNA